MSEHEGEQAFETYQRLHERNQELEAEVERLCRKVAEMGNLLIDCTEERDEAKADSALLDKLDELDNDGVDAFTWLWAEHFGKVRDAIDKLEEP